jgi:hypothetical protein
MKKQNKSLRIIVTACIVVIIYLIPNDIKAQRAKEISLYYRYFAVTNSDLLTYSGDKYPKGFGVSMTSQFSRKLAWKAGLNFSNKKEQIDKTLFGLPGSPTRIVTDYNISFISLNIGLAIPITEKKLSARFQGQLVPIYYFGEAKEYTYVDSNMTEDSDSINELSLGINLSFRFRFLLTSSAAIFVEPGSSYFFFGEIKEYQSININAGISYCF